MKRKNIKNDISAYFFMNPTARLRVRQIERELQLPLPSVIRYCKELADENILRKEITSGVSVYAADRASKRFLFEKKMFNLRQIFDSGLIEYLAQEHSNPPVVLFGSFAKGEDIERSDIDIYIETAKKQEFALEMFKKKLHHDIHVLNFKNIQDIPNIHLANNIINGTVLNNFIEVFR